MENKAVVTVEMSWMRRWAAVRLAVRRTPSANGRMFGLLSILLNILPGKVFLSSFTVLKFPFCKTDLLPPSNSA